MVLLLETRLNGDGHVIAVDINYLLSMDTLRPLLTNL